MAKITIVNISDETIAVRPSVTAEKVPLKPGQKLECDRDYAEANCLKTYADFFRVEGGSLPGLKEVLEFIEKATDAEKAAIITAAGGTPPADVPAEETASDPAADDPEQATEEKKATDAAGTGEQATEGGSASDGDKEPAPQQPAAKKKAEKKA